MLIFQTRIYTLIIMKVAYNFLRYSILSEGSSLQTCVKCNKNTTKINFCLIVLIVLVIGKINKIKQLFIHIFYSILLICI